MPTDDEKSDQSILRKISMRMERVEAVVEQIPALRNALETADSRMRSLSQRDDELSTSFRQLSETHIRAFENFSNMLQKQRAEHQDALMQQETRWRDSLDRIEAQHISASKQIADETISRISSMAVRGTFGALVEWSKPIFVTAVIGALGWLFHAVFFG